MRRDLAMCSIILDMTERLDSSSLCKVFFSDYRGKDRCVR